MISFIETIGWITIIVFVSKVFWNLIYYVYSTWLASVVGKNVDLKNYGPWAVITGATDGCGKVYAFKLASLGLNVVLVSRSEEKLKNVADEIRETYGPVEVKTIAVDFTEGVTIYSQLKNQLKNLEVGVLVNNVGMSVEFDEMFHSLESDRLIQDVINCNCMSMARMCHIILPGMIQREKGVIINVGSLSSAAPVPLSHVYGASKAFVDKLSNNLDAECREHGIILQSLVPGILATKMSLLPPSLLIPDPETFVDASFRTLGVETRTAAFWVHKIMLYWAEVFYFFLPDWTHRVIKKYILAECRERKKILKAN